MRYLDLQNQIAHQIITLLRSLDLTFASLKPDGEPVLERWSRPDFHQVFQNRVDPRSTAPGAPGPGPRKSHRKTCGAQRLGPDDAEGDLRLRLWLHHVRIRGRVGSPAPWGGSGRVGSEVEGMWKVCSYPNDNPKNPNDIIKFYLEVGELCVVVFGCFASLVYECLLFQRSRRTYCNKR